MKKILVTGSAGFIGFHLTKALLRVGYQVTGIDNLNDYYDPQLKKHRLNVLDKYVFDNNISEKYNFVQLDISNDFSSWEEGYIEREKKVFDVLQERVLAWKHTVSEVVNDLINCLYTNLIEIEQDFADQVFINVLESSINIELTKQQFKEYKCPNQLGIIEKTVIYLLDSGSNADLLNASTLKKMRPEFKVLDNKLKSDFDELGGINSECKTQIEAEIKTIDEFSEILEEDVIQISKNLFDPEIRNNTYTTVWYYLAKSGNYNALLDAISNYIIKIII